MALQLNLSDPSSKKTSLPQAESGSKRRLMIVDDETMLLEVLASIFRDSYDLRTAVSGDEALEIIAGGFKPEVIIADQRMPGMSGAQFLARSITTIPESVRVVLTGYTDVQDIIDSINLGNVYRFITKPWQRDEIIETVRLCFEHFDMITRHAELEAAHVKLRELSEEKDEFLGIAAHDLKNPLGGIRGLAEMLLMHRSDIDEQQISEILQSILDSSERMFDLIKNLLEINALERGGLSVNIVPFDISMPVFEIVEIYKPRAASKRIALHYAHKEGSVVLADETVTMQILDNLVSNAVKYSPPNKSVFIEITRHGADADTKIRVSVRDEGPGISAEDQEKLFGKFTRLTARPTGGEHSTGLGLSIVKKMVEVLSGDVWCESELGQGATFIVELPCGEISED